VSAAVASRSADSITVPEAGKFLPGSSGEVRVRPRLISVASAPSRRLIAQHDRDPALAGIPKTDGRGWTIDGHALRHTLGTLLSRGNVAPRTTPAAMRHSTIDLTMNVYADPQLLVVAGALERLPELSLDADSDSSAAKADRQTA
jgi:hypothetical protein